MGNRFSFSRADIQTGIIGTLLVSGSAAVGYWTDLAKHIDISQPQGLMWAGIIGSLLHFAATFLSNTSNSKA